MLKRILSEGVVIPKGYGVAYYDLMTNRVVCYPIPLNWIVAIARKVYWFLRTYPINFDIQSKIYGDGYSHCQRDTQSVLAAFIRGVVKEELNK